MILSGRLLIDPYQSPRNGWLRFQHETINEMGYGPPPQAPDLGDDRCLICPGFIDAHLHLPQFQAIGCLEPDLLTWLEKIIYPVESGWADPLLARRQIRLAHQRLLRAGTLGYAGYLSSHPHSPRNLAQAHALPLRATVGPTLMDRNAPENLLNPPPQPSQFPHLPRTGWSLNPRFAVSCSDSLLGWVNRAAADGSFIQTHLSESTAECAMVAELFPSDGNYAAVYERHGLLTERTLLAHCLHLSQEEWQLIARRRCVVVHCPTANLFLRSGFFDLDAARDHAVRLALGSDIAAGPDLAMPRVARAMIETARIRAATIAPDARIPTPADAWHLITAGNAEALGWSDAGRLEIGAAADLLIIRPPFPFDEHLLGRLIHTWSDDYIAHRILAGRLMDCPADEDDSSADATSGR